MPNPPDRGECLVVEVLDREAALRGVSSVEMVALARRHRGAVGRGICARSSWNGLEVVGVYVVMRAVVAAAVVPVAAFVAVDPAGWYPFGPAKWFAVSVVAVVSITLLTLEPSVVVPRRLGWLWLALLLLVGLSMFVALDPRLAWLGTTERNLGLATWVLFAAMMVVGANVGRGGVAGIGVLVRGVVVGTLGVAAYVGIELITGPPIEVAASTVRLGGPFGSAAYLGAAMTMAVPICAGMSCDRTVSVAWRVAASAAVFGGAVGLVGSGSRGAIVAATVAGVVVVALRCRPCKSGLRDRRWLMLGGSVLAAVVVVGVRLGAVVTDRSAPASSRLDEWATALRVVVEHPVLGGGPESYRIAVARAIGATYERTYGRGVMPDRAHSAPLDVAAIAGVPAAVVYVVMVALVVAAGVRLIGRAGPMTAGLGAAVVAYTAQQLVLFPIAELDVVFWLLGGAVVVSAGAEVFELRWLARAPVTVLGGLALVVVLALGVAAVSSDRLARSAASFDAACADDMEAGGCAAGALADARRAIRLRPDSVRVRVLAADLATVTGTLDGVDTALGEIAAARDWSPQDPFLASDEARLLLRRAEITGNEHDVATAWTAWRTVAAEAPNCYQCQLGLGAAAALAGDDDAARDAWSAAAVLSDEHVAADLIARLDAVAAPGES
jgi:O-antigen ligase